MLIRYLCLLLLSQASLAGTRITDWTAVTAPSILDLHRSSFVGTTPLMNFRYGFENANYSLPLELWVNIEDVKISPEALRVNPGTIRALGPGTCSAIFQQFATAPQFAGNCRTAKFVGITPDLDENSPSRNYSYTLADGFERNKLKDVACALFQGRRIVLFSRVHCVDQANAVNERAEKLATTSLITASELGLCTERVDNNHLNDIGSRKEVLDFNQSIAIRAGKLCTPAFGLQSMREETINQDTRRSYAMRACQICADWPAANDRLLGVATINSIDGLELYPLSEFSSIREDWKLRLTGNFNGSRQGLSMRCVIDRNPKQDRGEELAEFFVRAGISRIRRCANPQ